MQDALEKRLKSLFRGKACFTLAGAGRTDAGVHAGARRWRQTEKNEDALLLSVSVDVASLRLWGFCSIFVCV